MCLNCENDLARDEALIEFLLSYYGTKTPQQLRRGQFLFNELHAVRPDLANSIRATDVDPFYRNDLIDAALCWIITNWG